LKNEKKYGIIFVGVLLSSRKVATIMEKQEVFYVNKEMRFNAKQTHTRRIDSVTIDITRWSEGKNYNEDGVFSYMAQFNDEHSHPQIAVCTGMKSGGMGKLLSELKAKHGLELLDTTTVNIICPKKDIANQSLFHGGISTCCLQALRYHGMNALDIYPTDRGKADIRLESVLDEVVHQSDLKYHTRFPKSIYHYDRPQSQSRAYRYDPQFD
jgi:hypothetical protein